MQRRRLGVRLAPFRQGVDLKDQFLLIERTARERVSAGCETGTLPRFARARSSTGGASALARTRDKVHTTDGLGRAC